MVNAISDWHVWAWSGGVVVGAVLIAAVGYRIIFLFLNRIARREGGQLVDSLIHRAKAPLRWILPFLALLVVLPVARLPADVIGPTQRAVGLLLIFAVGRLVIVCNSIIFDVVLAPHRLDLMDDLAARRMQTQVQILRRIALVTVAIVTLSLMLMTFPEIRHIGISLLASAGLAGLIIGTAMKSSISSLIAGIQIALTQPIRLEDSVVVEGEWGWVEEIGTTYVVVRLWDLRRMVLPISYFLEHPFQNWTRQSTELLGSVFLYVDYTVPVEEVRKELRRIVENNEKWQGQVCVLQVTDATANAIQLRALVDARDADAAWDLRCEVRERLIQFLQEKYPHGLPRVRTEFQEFPTGSVDPSSQPLARAASIKRGT